MKKYFQFISICILCLLLAGCSDTSELQELYNQKGKLMDTQKQTIQEYNKLYQEWLQLDKQIKELDKQIEKLKVKPLGYLGRKLLACEDCPDEMLHDKTGAIAPLINTWDKQDNLITDRDRLLMSRVCKYGRIDGKISPLCDNRDMYMSGKKIFADRGVPRDIALGVMFAESHIWSNRAWTCNESWNNRWGIKYRILDDWSRMKDQQIPNDWNWNKWWCRLYKFDSINDYFISKANTFTKYSWCFTQDKPITCMAYNYVWNPKVAEKSWIYRVSLIAE